MATCYSGAPRNQAGEYIPVHFNCAGARNTSGETRIVTDVYMSDVNTTNTVFGFYVFVFPND